MVEPLPPAAPAVFGTPLSPHALRVLLLGSGELGKEVAIELQRFGVEVVAVDRYAVQNGAFGIVMDVDTGEILAMATLGSYDPNQYLEIGDETAAAELEQMFRIMCFNVYAHNQDDHAKNFSFICRNGAWELSPAYDLTYSTTFGNEHSTSVNGKGKPVTADLLEVAHEFGIPVRKAKSMSDDICELCTELLMRNGLMP